MSLIAHPIESVAVTLAFEWYATGKCSDADVAERLNDYRYRLADGQEVGFRTKGIPGRYPPGPFSRSSVREILLRRFYTGVVAYYGADEDGHQRKRDDFAYTAPGKHPALVSQELFDQVQELRRFAARRRRNGQGVPCLYPLSGILRCASCERRMWGFAANGGVRYYRDSTRAERRGDCEQKTVRAEEIEEQVVDLLRRCQLPDDWQERIVEFLHPPEERAEVEEQEQVLQQRLERAQGPLSRDDRWWPCNLPNRLSP